MTEQERQEIENLLSEECAEDDFIIGGKIQTLDQYLKRYWIWKNREIFAPDFDYECKENIVDILKSKEDISDNRFEKIVVISISEMNGIAKSSMLMLNSIL